MQQWVLDTQMVSRIREILKREGVDIPGDRVVAFYHLPVEEKTEPELVHQIKRIWRKNEDQSSGNHD